MKGSRKLSKVEFAVLIFLWRAWFSIMLWFKMVRIRLRYAPFLIKNRLEYIWVTVSIFVLRKFIRNTEVQQ